ncbi:MAG TPA: hypothetical protein VFE24_18635 [Pirellulales bacterium]|jgi:hypothetical protein|nr:hypothetical protein [Pirellulales bacterium]
MPRTFRRSDLFILAAAAGLSLAAALPAAARDGYRPVELKRYGIKVQTPVAWRLITFGEDATAFELRLPQDEDAPREGLATCVLELWPDSLETLQKAGAQEVFPPQANQKRTVYRLEPLPAEKFGKELSDRLGQRLVTQWESIDAQKRRSFDVRYQVLCDGTLYTFRLNSDESHFDAYRLDFEDMFKSASFTAVETDWQKLAQHEWLQKKLRFSIKLPDPLKPAFSNTVGVFLRTQSAAGQPEFEIVGRAAAPLDPAKLKSKLPDEIRQHDPRAAVQAQVVPQGAGTALEVVIQTRQEGREKTILERHVHGQYHNYELRWTCEKDAFDKRAAEFRKALDSFHEVAPPEEPEVI